MKHYTPKEVNQIKQLIRTGMPLPLIANELEKQWGRPSRAIYSKVKVLAKRTKKITNEWNDSAKILVLSKSEVKPAVVQETIDFAPLEKEKFSLDEEEVIKEVCNNIIEISAFEDSHETEEQLPAKIEVEGIEVPVNDVAFVGTPSKVVIYKDHVRYYYSNENN
jgi:hypothetical protein